MSLLERLFARDRRDAEIAEEIRAHLEEKVEDLMEEGLSRRDAESRARREFGNVLLVEQTSREVWQWPTLESVVMDLRLAVRQLLRRPGLSAVMLATLAVGIGANAVLFTWTRSVLLEPLPGVGEPERVLAVEGEAASGAPVPVSYPDFRDLRESARLLESLSVTYPMALAVGEEPAERVPAELVSGGFFDLLRLQPAAGRFFSAAERGDAQGRHPVVVISHSYWEHRFHGDPSAVGSTLRINRVPFTVIGVAPSGFHGSLPALDFRIWAPATMFAQLNSAGTWMLEDRKTRMFRVLGRLAPGAGIEQARTELGALGARLAEAHPDTNAEMSVRVLPLWLAHYGIQDSLRAPLAMLSGVALLVLAIVCANMASLLLARAADRRRELALRRTLGAGRARLVRQLLTEAALLALVGSLLGLAIAAAFSGSLPRLLPLSSWLSVIPPGVDASVLAYTTALAVVVTLLAGVAPALFGARGDVAEALRESDRGTAGARSLRLRSLLVGTEMALAVTAIVAAGLFLKSFHLLGHVEPGFDPEHVVLGQFSLAASGYDAAAADAFSRRLRERLEEEPGVVAVSYADYVPLSIGAGSWEDLEVEGYVPDLGESMKIRRSIIAPGYFDVLRIPLLEGRDFDANDDDAHEPAMIVNEEFARRFFGGGPALGRRVHGWGRWFRVVGVARDVKTHRLSESPTPYFYIPLRQVYRPEFLLSFFVRTSGPTDAAIAALRRESRGIGSAPPLFDTGTLSDSIAASTYRERTSATLLSLLAGIAFLLAAIGLYGVTAYSVAQRTGEIGVRVALGARRGHILGLVLRQAAVVVLAGLGAGLLGGALLARSAGALLFAVSATDPAVYLAAAGLTLLIVVLGTAVPAVRALGVEPTRALRYE